MAVSSDPQQFIERPFRTFLMLWVPVLFSLVAEPLTGLVDTAFVSRLGAVPLAALGVGAMVLSSVFWIFNFLSVGSQTEISQARGRQDHDHGRRIGSLAMILAAGIGTVIALLAVVFAPAMVSLMGAQGNVHHQAVLYIQIRAAGSPAILLTITAFGILYGLQDMRTPLKIALLVNALNILLDAVLIFGLGPVPALGIAGAAAASALSQWIGAVLGVRCVARRLQLTSQIRLGDAVHLFQVGIDMFIRTGLLTLFLLLATRSATRIGPDAGAAHQAIRQVWVFTGLFLDASAIAAQSLIGFFYGRKHIGDARRVARLVCWWSILVGTAITVMMLMARNLASAMLVPPTSAHLFFPAWMTAALIQPLAAVAFVTDGIHWGTGDFRYLRNAVILTTLCSTLGLWLLDEHAEGALTGIWVITGGWVSMRAILGIWRIWPGTAASPLRTSTQAGRNA